MSQTEAIATLAEETKQENPPAAEAAAETVDTATINTALADQLDEFKELNALREQIENPPEATSAKPQSKPAEESSKPEPTAEKAAAAEVEESSAGKEAPEPFEIERLKREIRARDGKYGSELAKLRKENEELKARLQAEAEAREAQQIASFDPEAEPTDDDLKAAWGADYEDQIGKDFAIRQLKATRREQKRILGTVDQIVQRKLESIQAKTAAERLASDLEAAVPGAQALNADADVNGFASYLDSDFNGTGFSRRDVAERALSAIKAGADGATYEREKARLVGIFKGFSSGGGGVSPARPTNQTKAPAAKPSSKPDKSLYMSPATSAADSVPKGAKMTLKQVEEALGQGGTVGNFDVVMAQVLNKAARNEVV